MRMNVVLTWKRLAGLVVFGIASALLVGWSGLVPIAASSGHWAVTSWFLHWTMQNAAATQSMSVEKPAHVDLDDPALILRSAGHFATGCAACHGAPGVAQSPVVKAMVPAPPRLDDKVGEWTDAELFWIVKNGIKFSGMPAWPAQHRDDEVWAQVAFLRALPGMSSAEYAGLSLGGGLAGSVPEAGAQTLAARDGIFETALSDCARCHGRDGLGRGDGATQGAFPVIAGQSAPYLYATLLSFASGQRPSGFMEPPATRYAPDVLADLARHYARQPGARQNVPLARDRLETPVLPPQIPQDDAGILEGAGDLAYAMVPLASAAGPPVTRTDLRDLGRRIAVEGISDRKIPACQSCHGAAGQARNAYYPSLAGQPEWYLAAHLRLWRDGVRGGTAYAPVMGQIARNLTDEQIDALAVWYANLYGLEH